MIFGKHINRYYLKYAGWLLLGLLSLVVVDYMQLRTPELYGLIVDGMSGKLGTDFDMNYVDRTSVV